jgi:hypothetical protein
LIATLYRQQAASFVVAVAASVWVWKLYRVWFLSLLFTYSPYPGFYYRGMLLTNIFVLLIGLPTSFLLGLLLASPRRAPETSSL